MAEESRQLTDGQKMLRYFYEELEAAFERGEPDLILQISRIAGDADVYIRPVTTGGLKNVAEELGLDSGARAVSLLRRLDDGGYLRLNYGSSGPNLDILTPTMEYIPDRGLFEIGELPHPDGRGSQQPSNARGTSWSRVTYQRARKAPCWRPWTKRSPYSGQRMGWAI
jgi:hypothetical protein